MLFLLISLEGVSKHNPFDTLYMDTTGVIHLKLNLF